MARSYDPPTPTLPLLVAAAQGALAALTALLGLASVAWLRGAGPWVAANALGAWLVRWLQTADRPSLSRFYVDATIAGVLLAAAAGGLGGLWGHVLHVRCRSWQPVAGSVLLALAGCALVTRVLAPALNPVLLRDLPGLTWPRTVALDTGGGLGPGLRAVLGHSAAWWVASLAYGILLGLGLQCGSARTAPHRLVASNRGPTTAG